MAMGIAAGCGDGIAEGICGKVRLDCEKGFTDWAFAFVTSFLYYMDYDTIDEQTRSLYRQGISAFGGIAPTYRIALKRIRPLSYGRFHSCSSWCR